MKTLIWLFGILGAVLSITSDWVFKTQSAPLTLSLFPFLGVVIITLNFVTSHKFLSQDEDEIEEMFKVTKVWMEGGQESISFPPADLHPCANWHYEIFHMAVKTESSLVKERVSNHRDTFIIMTSSLDEALDLVSDLPLLGTFSTMASMVLVFVQFQVSNENTLLQNVVAAFPLFAAAMVSTAIAILMSLGLKYTIGNYLENKREELINRTIKVAFKLNSIIEKDTQNRYMSLKQDEGHLLDRMLMSLNNLTRVHQNFEEAGEARTRELNNMSKGMKKTIEAIIHSYLELGATVSPLAERLEASIVRITDKAEALANKIVEQSLEITQKLEIQAEKVRDLSDHGLSSGVRVGWLLEERHQYLNSTTNRLVSESKRILAELDEVLLQFKEFDLKGEDDEKA